MQTAPLQRTVWLAGVTLVAALIAVGLTHRGSERASRSDRLPHSVPVPGSKGGWYLARVAPYEPPPGRARTSCGQRFGSTLEGIAHPVLPCGVKIFLLFRGRQVLTQVVDRGPRGAGREFDLTKPLANRIELHGKQRVKWRFAR